MLKKQFYIAFIVLTVLFIQAHGQEFKTSDEKKQESAEYKRRMLLKKKRLRALRARKARLEQQKKEALTASKEDESAHQFSFHDLNPILRYTYTTDINEQTDALDGSNSLSLAFSYMLKNKVSLFSGLSLSYETVDSAVFRSSENEDFFRVSDLYIGAGYQAKVQKPYGLNFGGSLSVPTSDRSRFEGYKAVISGNASLRHLLPKIKNLSFGVTGSFTYVVNTFDFSPVTGETQFDGRGVFSGTLVYKLPYGFRYIGSVWSSASFFVDGSDLTRFGNTHTLFWTKDNISTYIRYSNSDLPERGATDFWFIDEYRKIFSLGLVVRAKMPEALKRKRTGARPFVNTSVFEED